MNSINLFVGGFNTKLFISLYRPIYFLHAEKLVFQLPHFVVIPGNRNQNI